MLDAGTGALQAKKRKHDGVDVSFMAMSWLAPTGLCPLQVLEALQRGAAHESLVCCAAYLLGEYGRQVQQVPLRDQFALLQERFVTVSSEAKVSLPAQPLAAFYSSQPLTLRPYVCSSTAASCLLLQCFVTCRRPTACSCVSNGIGRPHALFMTEHVTIASVLQVMFYIGCIYVS